MASPFSATANRKAAMWNATYLTGVQGDAFGVRDNAMTNSLGALGEGRANSINALNGGYDQARQGLGQGYGQAQNYLGQAYDLWNPSVQQGNAALQTLGNATGINGSDAQQQASGLFRNVEGYNGGLNTGLDEIERRAAARGQLAGGNTSADTIKYASDYDARNYGQWFGNVNTLANLGQSGLTAQTGIRNAQAGNAMTYGQGLGNLGAQQGAAQSDIYNTGAARLSDLYQSDANTRNAVQLGIGNQIASAGSQAMVAGQQAAQNRWGAGMALANLGVGALGSVFGGGLGGGMSLLSGLGGSSAGPVVPGTGGLLNYARG